MFSRPRLKTTLPGRSEKRAKRTTRLAERGRFCAAGPRRRASGATAGRRTAGCIAGRGVPAERCGGGAAAGRGNFGRPDGRRLRAISGQRTRPTFPHHVRVRPHRTPESMPRKSSRWCGFDGRLVWHRNGNRRAETRRLIHFFPTVTPCSSTSVGTPSHTFNAATVRRARFSAHSSASQNAMLANGLSFPGS